METEIKILYTSDVHGYVGDAHQRKGILRAASLIKKLRANLKQHVVLIDNGDLIQGTSLAQYAIDHEEVNPIISLYNEIGYEAAVFGNHEFNYGAKKLQSVVAQSRFPWISANIVRKDTDEPFYGKPYIVREFNGFKIGILGLTTKFVPVWEKPTNIQQLHFLDPVEVAPRWIKEMREKEQVDFVIVSYHGGLEVHPETGDELSECNGENQGIQLIREVAGIDALFTGHQHIIVNEEVRGVSVLQTGTQGQYVGALTIKANKQADGWKTVKKTALLPVDEEEQDQQIYQLIEPIVKRADKWMDEKIGSAAASFRYTDPLKEVWLQEHPVIEWMNRVQMETANVDISCTALLNASCFGLQEKVTRKSILELYPFPNTLVVMELTGEQIREALEVSASFFDVKSDGTVTIHPQWEKPRSLSYNYDMWEGIDYIIDVRNPIGKRIKSIHYHGVPLKPTHPYKVVMSNYRATGTGGYEMVGRGKVIKEYKEEVSHLLMEAVIKAGTIHANVNHNWIIEY
ncbi:bifunctional metallophosphatase/5'-nucleotidase [Bacillus aquiflavi]|uniref:Bifunctional metallophosphatase/5'-nucleotidase n=1 Tax=Bacillus aquiflavi TaxID=2672567 RepID=A0A6B3W0K7_9BACI|nr:bifunctional UDP-sugar hydrolase/5'-nucleotidase [Bacillus aquiflavi]MBA4537869.1 bifunctional metallophosphatase/5'-nucleotidase [Bacillus aquiflavi]NEY82125.1 bifunctional metallophosphatase/5'-nucleotidase [Bacillus aquiflavi]UAC48431.1 bifunctional metallophosphatase/5'-nucleotidase [Bacillus aquiflavi]